MKLLGLDIGDAWTGTALSDATGILARPLQTVETKNLTYFLKELFQKERILKVIVGHPRTMKGTSSEQTKKVEALKIELEKIFPDRLFNFMGRTTEQSASRHTQKRSLKRR